MPRLVDEHTCDSCDNQTYFLRLKEPQPVRVPNAKGEASEYNIADYALIQMHKITSPSGKVYAECSVWATDEDQNEYDAPIYMYNRERTLEEIIWLLGGEYTEETNGTA